MEGDDKEVSNAVQSDGPVRREDREVAPEQWGKAILEELLFQAALAAPRATAQNGMIEVTLSFSLRADQPRRLVEIATPGAVERRIVTRLPLD